MGPHHKRFGSARTARCVHTLDLVRAPPRVWQAGARGKGARQFGGLIHDCIQIHTNMPFNGLESTSGLRTYPVLVPQNGMDWASEHRILLVQEVRCRPPKCESRFPPPLTQDRREMPLALRRATQVQPRQPARATHGLVQGGGWLTPPH